MDLIQIPDNYIPRSTTYNRLPEDIQLVFLKGWFIKNFCVSNHFIRNYIINRPRIVSGDSY